MTDDAGTFAIGTTPDTAPLPPDDDTTAVGTEVSDLDAIREELAKPPAEDAVNEDDFTTIAVDTRPGYSIRCRLDFTGHDLDRWRKAAHNKRFTDKLDGIKFAALLIGATCVAVLRNGKPVSQDGEPIDYPFQNRAFMGTLGGHDVDSTVRAFFVREGLVDAAARRVTLEAGWGEDVYADPTV